MIRSTFFFAATLAASLGLTLRADEPKTPAYPLTTCVITGKPLDSMGGPVTIVHEGTEVKFCCQGCVGAFRRDPAPHLAKIKAAAEAKAAEGEAKAVIPYPLKVCLVSGEDLGGAPVSMVHEGRQIKFCCQGCQAKFEENPAPYLKKIEARNAGDAKPAPASSSHRH